MTGSVARAIPWEILGPAGILVIIILVLVFAFLLKYQMKKNTAPTPAPNPPKDTNSMDKHSVCFDHEGRISSNEATTKAFKEEMKKFQKNNRQDHDKIFTKIDDLGTKIITAINNRP